MNIFPDKCYHIIKYDTEGQKDISSIVSSEWFDKKHTMGVKYIHLPINKSDHEDMLLRHKRPLLKSSIILKGYDIIDTFGKEFKNNIKKKKNYSRLFPAELNRAKKYFAKMIKDEEETSSDNASVSEITPKIKIDYDALILK